MPILDFSPNWDSAKAGTYVHPDPEVPSRLWCEDDIPAPRMLWSLTDIAREHGWTVEILYSRGTSYSARSDYRQLMHTCAARCIRGSCRVAAVWERPVHGEKWKFSYGAILGSYVDILPDGTYVLKPFPFSLKITELKKVLRGPGLTCRVLMDQQYLKIENVHEYDELMCESDFRENIQDGNNG